MSTTVGVVHLWYVTRQGIQSGFFYFGDLFVLAQSPCCGKVYPCRFCHNENEPTHELNRFAVSEVVCRNCNTRQPVRYSYHRNFRTVSLFSDGRIVHEMWD